MRHAALFLAAACGASAPPEPSPSPTPTPSPPRSPITLTYLGVAGWQLDAGAVTVLADPYFSRPADFDAPLVPDEAAIAAHAPPRADLVFVGHSHHDHLLDAPTVALRTGAQILGSATTAHVARASGVPDDRIITVKGGEDFAMDGYSIRAIPSLHSAIGDKHIFGAALAAPPTLPMPASGYAEGGTFGYLVRVGGHEVLFLSTANFIERELEGLRPDVAIVGVGLREHVHDYTCRLLRALGNPPRVYANHFDDWQAPPEGQTPNQDTLAFVEEVKRCAPGTEVAIPTHFEAMTIE
jgi:L-ascorbate metabolism protein UlaG (beta-lactamase superfamily)